ncbi:hypothetical protein MTO96_046609 [Rhipicephalus appendiculatus]
MVNAFLRGRFKKYHRQQRVATESTFGLLKQRFRRLCLVDVKNIMPSRKIVLVACVLHNWCNAERDFLAEFVDLPDHEEVGKDEDDVDITAPSACEWRRQIIAQQ